MWEHVDLGLRDKDNWVDEYIGQYEGDCECAWLL